MNTTKLVLLLLWKIEFPAVVGRAWEPFLYYGRRVDSIAFENYKRILDIPDPVHRFNLHYLFVCSEKENPRQQLEFFLHWLL